MAGSVGVASGLVAMPSILRAADYPTRPINVIVPFATGGYNDRLSRAFAPYLEKELGQPLVIVNKPGAGTQLGNSYALNQPADGYSILCTSAAPYIPLTVLLQNAPYKVEDFSMLNLPSRDYTLAATSSDSPIKTFAEVIEKLQADPGSLSIGVQPASADYANMVLAFQAAKIDPSKLRIVTYDGGGPARNATAGAQVDVGFVGGEGFLPLVSKIRPLAIFAEETVDWYPDAPLIGASGLKVDFVEGSQRGWVVTTKLKKEQPEIFKFLSGALERASKNPKAIEALKLQQLATTWYGPEASEKAYLANADKMAKYIDLMK
ncbi:tripartite tricarboxylate transporter substrate binding protein [Ancylobacter sp. MQZ15Z-1]|uniref:Tripartite tricarboxylate transporter substrate binding protein n=1 Tax=Ancylobacter mangrovi TaxID=2972472 RepID=A0A9X2PFL8_9HYPH|nr:tripartite tricarboxylate transporter substrate binding protein [Ancylobacter mangrovi]MCS0494582.1 tripartite tricarboxylate transporter substrate binding protein [Ancylobacter mangrovi]